MQTYGTNTLAELSPQSAEASSYACGTSPLRALSVAWALAYGASSLSNIHHALATRLAGLSIRTGRSI